MSFSNNKKIIDNFLSKFAIDFCILAILLFLIVVLYHLFSSSPKKAKSKKNNSMKTDGVVNNENSPPEIFIRSEKTSGCGNSSSRKSFYIVSSDLSIANEILTKANTYINKNLFINEKERKYNIDNIDIKCRNTDSSSFDLNNKESSNLNTFSNEGNDASNTSITHGNCNRISKNLNKIKGLFEDDIKIEFYSYIQLPEEESDEENEDYESDEAFVLIRNKKKKLYSEKYDKDSENNNNIKSFCSSIYNKTDASASSTDESFNGNSNNKKNNIYACEYISNKVVLKSCLRKNTFKNKSNRSTKSTCISDENNDNSNENTNDTNANNIIDNNSYYISKLNLISNEFKTRKVNATSKHAIDFIKKISLSNIAIASNNSSVCDVKCNYYTKPTLSSKQDCSFIDLNNSQNYNNSTYCNSVEIGSDNSILYVNGDISSISSNYHYNNDIDNDNISLITV